MRKNFNLKKLFIIRLYHHSKLAFVLIMLYIFMYAFFFFKKMDMVMFPYNSMFSIDFTNDYSTDTYQLKLDDQPVNFTHQWWWKKDFMETSLRTYVSMLNDVPYIEKYINYAYANKPYHQLLLQQLKPSLNNHRWLAWYANFGNQKTNASTVFSIWKYHLFFSNGAIAIDSSLLLHQKLQP